MLAFYLTMIPEEDREDFTDLYNRYEKRMLYIARQRTGDEHLAEDVVQETFLIIAKDFEKFS
ncbi:hypothetical protein FACS18949_10590 [Clostridia bacterium]|nr:hypothetical protein FACS18949_10590 [Clostridia bacterium]